MAPPKIGKLIPIRLPDDMIAKLDARRARSGISRAHTVRSLLGWALAAQSGIGANNEAATESVSDKDMEDFVAWWDSPRE